MRVWDGLRRFMTLNRAPSRHQFSGPTVGPIDQQFLRMALSQGHVSREEALSIPGGKRARDLICGAISTFPLEQLDADNNVVPFPLLEQIDPDVPNVVTLAQTAEDLFFDAISWWRVLERDANGWPIYAQHLDYRSVRILNEPSRNMPSPLPGGYDPRRSKIYVDGELIRDPGRELIRFDSPNQPILAVCARTIRNAIAYDKAAEMYARNPRPLDYFTETDNAEQLTDEQAQARMDSWITARQLQSVALVRRGWEYNTVDSPAPKDLQLVELQDKVARDIAIATGLDPSDLGVAVTTDTYANKIDRRQDRINDVYAPYMKAITDRLSMPDITRRRNRIVFDLDGYLRADPLTRMQVNTGYLAAKVKTVDEVRKEEKLPDLTDEQRAELKPEPATPVDQQDQVNGQDVPNNVVPIRQANAAGGHRMTFESDAPVKLTLNFALERFSFDHEKRTIEGIVVPYGRDKVAYKDGQWWRFQEGSLRYREQSRNKLLRDHDFNQPLGPLVHDEETPTGRFARYSVGRGADGDRALMEAEDKVRDGFSVGVDIFKFTKDPLNPGVNLVTDADWYETSVLALPAFDDARATKVTASRDQGETMPDTVEPTPAPAAPAPVPGAVDFNTVLAQALAQQFANARPMPMVPAPAPELEPERPTLVNPLRNTATLVREPQPYRFDRKGNLAPGSHDFSNDLIIGLRDGDIAAYNRAMSFVRAQFDVATADMNELSPTINHPELYVDQRDFLYPIWNAVVKGTLTSNQPFIFPKYNSSSGLVQDHSEGVEPSSGTFTTADSGTITPTAVDGKLKIRREAWDQGGNPQLSGLLWRQMTKAWFEALENFAVTTFNAASLITVTGVASATDSTLDQNLADALADLQFVRGGFSMDNFVVHKAFYKNLVKAKDSNGRRLFPMLAPQNATGTTASKYAAVDVGGLLGRPAWALTTASYLFDTEAVYGWASAPQRIDMTAIEISNVYIGLWGYKAMVIRDSNGVRKFT